MTYILVGIVCFAAGLIIGPERTKAALGAIQDWVASKLKREP